MNIKTFRLRIPSVWFIILIIMLIGAVVRVTQAEENFKFGVDQYADIRLFSETQEIIRSGRWEDLPLRGQQGTYPLDLSRNNELIYNGALYTYIFSLLTLLTGTTPEGLLDLSMVMSLLVIPVAYLAGNALFNRRVGILCALLVACSYKLASAARVFWTPTPLPLFMLLAVFAYANILKGRRSYWPLLGFSAAAASQMHNAGYFIPLFFAVVLVLQRPALPLRISGRLAAVSAFLLPILPTLWSEMTGGFVLVRSMAHVFWVHLTQQQIGLDIGSMIGEWIVFARWVLGDLPQIHAIQPVWNIFWVLLSLCCVVGMAMGIRHVRRGGTVDPSWAFCLFWAAAFFFFPWIHMMYYGFPLTWSLIGLIQGGPVLLLIFAAGIDVLLKYRQMRPLATTVLCLYVGLNLVAIRMLLWENEFGTMIYEQKREVVELIARDAGVIPYGVQFLESPGNGYELLYLFQHDAKSLPQRFNGLVDLGWMRLPGGNPAVRYTVIRKSLTEKNGIDAQWGTLIDETEHLLLFKRRV